MRDRGGVPSEAGLDDVCFLGYFSWRPLPPLPSFSFCSVILGLETGVYLDAYHGKNLEFFPLLAWLEIRMVSDT